LSPPFLHGREYATGGGGQKIHHIWQFRLPFATKYGIILMKYCLKFEGYMEEKHYDAGDITILEGLDVGNRG